MLPDRLKSGDKLRTKAGLVVSVQRTSQKDTFDEPLYRLIYPDTREFGGGVTGHRLWSRDELNEEGLKLESTDE